MTRLRKAAELQPDDARTHADLGLALEMAGQRHDAETAYRAALALDHTSPQILLNFARLLDGQARDGEAAELYAILAGLRPDMALAHSKLAHVQLRLMLPKAAIVSARKALAIEPQRVDALQVLASALDTTGQLKKR